MTQVPEDVLQELERDFLRLRDALAFAALAIYVYRPFFGRRDFTTEVLP